MEINANRYQKVVGALAGRLKNKLPCNSGHTLDTVEADEIVQEAIDALTDLPNDALAVIVWTLASILDTLSKQADENNLFSLETLQSQLFILKVLSVNLASRLSPRSQPPSTHPNLNSPTNTNAPNTPIPGSATVPPPIATSTPYAFAQPQRRHTSSEHSTSETASYPQSSGDGTAPPPLEERCARYVLSIILTYLRQSAPSEVPLTLPSKTSDITFRDFEVDGVGDWGTTPAPGSSEGVEGRAPIRQPHLHLRNQHSTGSVLSSSTSASIKTKPSSILTPPPPSHSSSSPYSHPSHAPLPPLNPHLIPAYLTKYTKTHSSLTKSRTACISLISHYSGHIISFLSLTNYATLYDRLRTKIRSLANKPEELQRGEDLTDLTLLGWIVFDRQRLVMVLNELSSLLVNMVKEAQWAIAIPLRKAVWNWIEGWEEEFNELARSTVGSSSTSASAAATTTTVGNMGTGSTTAFGSGNSASRGGSNKLTEGAPERVFDLLYSKMKSGGGGGGSSTGGSATGMALITGGGGGGGVGGEERLVWPTLTALCCIISGRLALDYVKYSGKVHKLSRKDLRFLDEMLKQASSPGLSKHSEVGLAAAVDLCRAATFAVAEEHEEVPLRLLAIDIAHEIKSALNQISQKLPGRTTIWEADEIDVVLYANVLVTVYRFLSPEESVPLIKEWLEPTRSDAVKICAVRACLTLAQEASRFPWQRSLTPLHVSISKRLREVFKTLGHRRPELDSYGAMKHPDSKPKAKRIVSESLSDKELLMLGILSLWRQDANFHTTGASKEDLEEWVGVVVKIWDMNVDNCVKVSVTTCLCRLAVGLFRSVPGVGATGQGQEEGKRFELMSKLIKASLPATLLSVSVNLLRARDNIEMQRLWVSLALQVLDLYLVKIEGQHVKDIQLDADRVPAFVMAEIAFTVTLTSSNNVISQLAAKGLRHLAIAQRQPDAPRIDFISAEDYAKRARVFDQLGDPKVTVVGRVGHQKRVRKHLRLLAPCHAIDVVVWNECHKRWRLLTEPVLDMVRDPSRVSHTGIGPAWKDQDQKFQWHNLTLFMAAFGGICLENAKEARNKLVSMIPYKYLPDELLAMEDIYPYLNPFLSDLNRILTISCVATRDLAREALGAELHPKLYPRVLKYLDETTRAYEQDDLSEEYLLFLEQFIAILKLILDNERNLEEKMTFDISPTLMSLTNMISRCEGSQTFRLRMKFCGLCDGISMRMDTFILRKESPARQNIIELLMEWMEVTVPAANSDLHVDEFNVACLKTLVKLLDKFQLRFTDTLNAGDDTIHVVSREFNKYSHMLLQFLEMYQPDYAVIESDDESEYLGIERLQGSHHRDNEIRELVITGLANLVSANSEIGFKQCLPLAYDQDKRKKVIFAHVFARVIGQGTTFNAEERSAAQSRNARLVELVRGSKLALALTIVEVCPFTEDDMMISVMLNIFDTRAPLTSFLKALIDAEIASVTSEVSLFRHNSVGNKFVTAFAKIHGYNYLRGLIAPLITFMKELPVGHSYEMDPSKAKEQDLLENQRTVEYAASKFLSLVTSSLPQMPPMIREISAYISHRVAEIWPTSKFSVMGAFIFLRFITPAVVSPETVDIELPMENGMTMRRGLMLIGKILQNLANNIFFGKEAHMTPLNKFLEGQIANVTRFLSEIHKSPPSAFECDDPWQGTISDDTDAIVLHRFLDRHADKIGKELLSMSRPATDGGDPSTLNGKRAWDELCALLVDLGTPVGIPELCHVASQDSIGYHELMSRYSDQSTASVQNFFVETPPNDQGLTLFVLRLNKFDVEAIDIELLMYYILKTLNDSKFFGQPFDVIVDCTGFSSMSELPLQWLRFCAEIVPKDIRERFITAHVLNPNSLAQKYFRRLYNFMAGTAFCASIKTYVSVAQLLEELPENVGQVLSETNALEQELYDEFQDVTWKQFNSMRVPVALRVAASHIRITSRQRQPVSPSLTCRNVEIINLADIGDIYNIFTGQDMNEFIVRRRQGSTSYFFSHLRDPIVKAIRHAKGKLKDTQMHMSERFSRFSNVPATLLHIGFFSVDLEDETLRGAAYHLLGAVCNYLKYDKSPIVATQAGVIPIDPLAFMMQLSDKLAEFAPQLTLDFIHEVSASLKVMGKDVILTGQCSASIHYMSPWIKNLAHFVNPTHSLYERSGARLRDCIRTLAELSVTFATVTPTLQRCIWAEISKCDNAIVDTVLDELIRTASDGGVNNPRSEIISHIVSTISSISVRGRVYHKLRKALNRPPTHLANNVSQHANYSEISTLVKMCLVVGSQSRQLPLNQLYVPEIMHIVMLVAADGPLQVRKSVNGVVLNLLQSLYVARTDDMPATELLQIIKDFTSPSTLQLFGLQRHFPTSKHTLWTPHNDKQYLDNLEQLAAFLSRILEIASGSKGLLNIWRARWMSLVTSTAFQNIPAIQTRSFVALAALANQDVDDDFLYQILVAFRAALVQADENHSNTVVSMLRCICRVIPILQKNSRYISSVFWLAVSLLQSSYSAFYVEATILLRASLEAMEEQDMFRDRPVEVVLLEGRLPLEEITEQLDRLLKLSFESNFSFTLAAIIFKGMRLRHFKEYAEAALRTLLRVTVRAERDPDATRGFKCSPSTSVLGYFLALLPTSTTPESYRSLVRECDIGDAWLPDAGLPETEQQFYVPRVTHTFLNIIDPQTALFAATFIGTMLSTAQGDDAETEMLYSLLADLGHTYPDTVSLVFGNIQDKVINAFHSSSNPAILRYVSSIYRISQPDIPELSNHENISTSTLNTIEDTLLATPALLNALELYKMQGLAQSLQFLPMNNGYATKMINWIPGLVDLMI